MDLVNGLASVVLHITIAVFLAAYLPISLVWRMIRRRFVKPLRKEDMAGKVVLITGASSGIGEQLAYEYARRGAYMALVARRKQALHDVALTAQDLGAPDVLVLPADISNPDESKWVVEETVAHFGQLNHLVANAGIGSCCFFEDITNITAFTKVMDVNFWGAVYPTYYALPHLKKNRGNIIATASIAGRVPTARLSFYNASKAAMIRFYETIRSELGSEIQITILLPGYVVSEMTKGKFISDSGEVGISEEARDIQVGPLPIENTKRLATIVVDSACRGQDYVTWPSWYRTLHMVMCLAPEVINWFSCSFYIAKAGNPLSNIPLTKRILEVTGAKKFLYPSAIHSAAFKKDE
ncbi:11-beta-hydroxysteroid dehydrogenase A-like [Typha angustifolia]|uniref:11-beta-hydroxysteroid dehydrogenase A-like n=1 Tax=Typha angustifolia TaxID=59011 RepID=UPI003C2C9AE7